MKEKSVSKICSIFGAQKLPYICQEFCTDVYGEILNCFDIPNSQTFYFGGQGDFEEICYRFISNLKATYAEDLQINRVFCVKDRTLLPKQRRTLMPEKYDDVIYLCPTLGHQEKSSYLRDCAMIDASECVIFCVEEKGNSNAYKAYKYAKSTGKKVVNLWERYAPLLLPRDEVERLLHMRRDAFTVY